MRTIIFFQNNAGLLVSARAPRTAAEAGELEREYRTQGLSILVNGVAVDTIRPEHIERVETYRVGIG